MNEENEENKKSWWRGAKDKVEGQIENQQAAKADNEAQYGEKVVSKMFAGKWVTIYGRGYVRVTDIAPTGGQYERLLDIDLQTDTVKRKNQVGRGAASLLTVGVSKAASDMKGHVTLTVSTDHKTHSLQSNRPTQGNLAAARALESAARGLLNRLNAVENVSSSPTEVAAAAPDALDQIRKLADLHAAGVLTDEEFAAKKADLLDRM